MLEKDVVPSQTTFTTYRAATTVTTRSSATATLRTSQSTSPSQTGLSGSKKDLKITTSGSKVGQKAAGPKKDSSGGHPRRCCATCSRNVVENKYVVGFTTLLTVYALTGDDIRLIATQASADFYFDIIVVVCLAVFTIEVILSCIGKDDYFLGFFFTLDVISTLTLVLDLSFAQEMVEQALSGGSDEDDEMGNLRAGRTARIGAKAARIVRVLRLVRILKLYKAYYDAQQRKKRLQEQGLSEPGSERDIYEDFDDFDDLEEGVDRDRNREKNFDRESRVGKKLSEMTTRKVIMLVLTMLLGLPFLKVSEPMTATSAQYGAEHLWRMLEAFNVDPSYYDRYAFEFLDYIHYHNWYSAKEGYCPPDNCANVFLAHLFWFGMTGKKDEYQKQVQELSIKARIKKTSVIDWEGKHAHQDNIFNYGYLPAEVLDLLSSKWKPGCDTKSQVRYGISLLDVEVPGANSHIVPCPEDLRSGERMRIKPRIIAEDQMKESSLVFYFDLRPYVRHDCALNLATTGVICVILCVASLYFASDANHLVLNPVENMIKRVEQIRENPLIAIKMSDEEFFSEMVAKERKSRMSQSQIWNKCKSIVTCQDKKNAGPMETVILERTIIKLGSLLALGFGEAGATIIGHNMKGTESAGVNAMVPGQRVECIIGIARIHNFAIATEVLQSKIMTFVNQIAEIVHGVVLELQGAPNKNNGESFFIIWQMSRDFEKYHESSEVDTSRLAGMSILAFSKILGGIHKSKVLAAYRTHPGLQQRLHENCYVKMGFGLHCGWAIEGAVGSEYKVDASYLSPNVSIAHSLEGATITYGVPLIVAESVVDRCTPGVKSKCREIDRVRVMNQRMKLYSVDMDPLALSSADSKDLKILWNSRSRFKARQFIDQQKQRLMQMTDIVEVSTMFDSDPDIVTMRKAYTSEFIHLFDGGFQNYVEGEWAVARRMLVETQEKLVDVRRHSRQDGPSTELLRFMSSLGFQAPNKWNGMRDLPKNVS